MGTKAMGKNWLNGSAAAAALMMFAQAVPAYAQEQSYSFNIPSQDLGSALKAFARASHQQVTFDTKAVRGKRAPELRGTFSASAALGVLLAGSGLTADRGRSGLFIIRASATASSSSSSSVGDANSTSEAGAENRSADIIVTGTNLRTTVALAAPTLSITRADIDATGYTTLADVFRSLPQNFAEFSPELSTLAGGISVAAGQNSQHAAGVDLRGLGSGSTLTLLNAHRIPGNVLGQVVDTSGIPLSLIDHVDIVTGGHSAVYGSDAVAGVVNIITRRKFDGAETQVSYAPTAYGGAQVQASQIFGKEFSRGGFVVAYDYSASEPVDLLKTGVMQTPVQANSQINKLWIQPKTNKNSVLASGQYEISDHITGTIDALFSRIITHSIQAYQSGPYISNNNTAIASNQYSLSGGVDASLPSRWKLKLSGTVGNVDNIEQYNFQTTAPAYNYNVTTLTNRKYSGSIIQGTAVANGPLFTLPAGDVSIAIGVEGRYEHLKSQLAQASTPEADLGRTVKSIYGEVLLPLYASNDRSRSINLSFAGRYDSYSDAGSAFTPQYGIVIAAARNLTFRSSYSEAFRAPDLYDKVFTSSAYLLNLTDPAVPSGRSTTLFVGGGNSALKPERAKTITFDVEYTPSFAPWLKITGDYFNISYTGRIATPDANITDALQLAAYFPGLIDRSPTEAEIRAAVARSASGLYNASGIAFNPATQNYLAVFPNIVVFDNRRANLSRENVSGFDVTAKATIPTGNGAVTLGLNQTYTLNHTRRLTPFAPSLSDLDVVGSPVAYRARANIGLSQGKVSAMVFINYTNGYKDNSSTPARAVDSWTTADLSLQADFSRAKNFLLSGTRLSLNVTNLLGTKPPAIYSNSFGIGYDPTNATAIGRIVAIRVTKKW